MAKESVGLRMAKASKEDLQKMYLAGHILENIFHYNHGVDSVTKADFEHFEKPLERKFIDPMFDGDELNAEEALRTIYGLFNCGSHGRVVMGCDMLIENCCDPDLNYLEWKPELKALLESEEEKEATND